jgi:hypothetical protein
METMRKWATIGVWLFVFIGLTSVAGCIHVAEFLGSIIIGIIVARSFYFSTSKESSDHLAPQK